MSCHCSDSDLQAAVYFKSVAFAEYEGIKINKRFHKSSNSQISVMEKIVASIT